MGCPFNVPQDPTSRKFFTKLGLIAAAVPLATIAPWARILGEDTDIAPMTEGIRITNLFWGRIKTA